MERDTPSLRLGTAGWNVPAACRELIGGEGSHLERYAQIMNAVEINTSFYKPHRRQTYERWARSTPDNFRFSVKVPMLITHEDDPAPAAIARFVDETTGLGAKLAVYLVQFAPSKAFNAKAAGALFDQLRSATAVPLVCKPRHASWFTEKADQWLTDHQISRVAADPARVAGADAPGGWQGMRYFRLHGSPRIYYASYNDEALSQLTVGLRPLLARNNVWCVFDNTTAGAALTNALALRERLLVQG